MKKKLAQWWKENKNYIGAALSTALLAGSSCYLGYKIAEVTTDAKWQNGFLMLQKDGFVKVGKTENGVFTELCDADASAAMREFYLGQ